MQKKQDLLRGQACLIRHWLIQNLQSTAHEKNDCSQDGRYQLLHLHYASRIKRIRTILFDDKRCIKNSIQLLLYEMLASDPTFHNNLSSIRHLQNKRTPRIGCCKWFEMPMSSSSQWYRKYYRTVKIFYGTAASSFVAPFENTIIPGIHLFLLRLSRSKKILRNITNNSSYFNKKRKYSVHLFLF